MIDAWAKRWGVPAIAVADLRRELGTLNPAPPPPSSGGSEVAGQSRIRALAPLYGMQLWRNNVGALMDGRGVPVRYGLANDSKQVNEVFKSSDLIGISNVTITPEMVGEPRGQFVAFECKHGAWKYSDTARERAQLAFIKVILAYGGRAKCITNESGL